MITNCKGQLLKVDLINNFVCQIVYSDNGCRESWGLDFWALGPVGQRRFFYQNNPHSSVMRMSLFCFGSRGHGVQVQRFVKVFRCVCVCVCVSGASMKGT